MQRLRCIVCMAIIFAGVFDLLAKVERVYAANDSVLPGFEDIPLAKDFIADLNTLLFFDNPAGRIIEIYAYTPADDQHEEALKFYRDTLPQLGWRQVSENQFERSQELLSIDVLMTAPQTLLRFTMKPQSQ